MKQPEPTEFTFSGIIIFSKDVNPLKHLIPKLICDVVLNDIELIFSQFKNALSDIFKGADDENESDVIFLQP